MTPAHYSHSPSACGCSCLIRICVQQLLLSRRRRQPAPAARRPTAHARRVWSYRCAANQGAEWCKGRLAEGVVSSEVAGLAWSRARFARLKAQLSTHIQMYLGSEPHGGGVAEHPTHQTTQA